jgi:hypothetical protein
MRQKSVRNPGTDRDRTFCRRHGIDSGTLCAINPQLRLRWRDTERVPLQPGGQRCSEADYLRATRT